METILHYNWRNHGERKYGADLAKSLDTRVYFSEKSWGAEIGKRFPLLGMKVEVVNYKGNFIVEEK